MSGIDKFYPIKIRTHLNWLILLRLWLTLIENVCVCVSERVSVYFCPIKIVNLNQSIIVIVGMASDIH